MKYMVLISNVWCCIHGYGYADICESCQGMAANPKDSYIGAAPTNKPPTTEKEKQTCH